MGDEYDGYESDGLCYYGEGGPLHDRWRVREGLDLWVVRRFMQNELALDPAGVLDRLDKNYPHHGKGQAIIPGLPQWVDGDNEALHIRGRPLKRSKMWFQSTPIAETGYLRYKYTGWQWRVLPATSCVRECPEMKTLFDAYHEWWDRKADCYGYSAPNHAIVTAYKDGSEYIGQHQDKTADLDENTLISVVKLGEDARPFQIVEKESGRILFHDVLRPGDGVIMSTSANKEVTHGVPEMDCTEPNVSGSVVFRTVRTAFKIGAVAQRIEATGRQREKTTEAKRARDALFAGGSGAEKKQK